MTEPIAFGAIGSEVFIADGDRLTKWSETAGLEHIPNISPAQYVKFNGGYMKDPEPEAEAAALTAYNDSPPLAGENLSDPDVLDMRGPHMRVSEDDDVIYCQWCKCNHRRDDLAHRDCYPGEWEPKR